MIRRAMELSTRAFSFLFFFEVLLKLLDNRSFEGSVECSSFLSITEKIG